MAFTDCIPIVDPECGVDLTSPGCVRALLLSGWPEKTVLLWVTLAMQHSPHWLSTFTDDTRRN